MRVREKLAWSAALVLALGVVASVAGVAVGGSLDPPGPPAPTGPIQAVITQPDPRIIEALSSVTIPAETGQYVNSAWFDVRDCERLDLFASADLPDDIAPELGDAGIYVHADASIDGVEEYGAILAGAGQNATNITLNPYTGPEVRSSDILRFNRDTFKNAPYVRVAVYRSDQSQIADAVVSASLYCS